MSLFRSVPVLLAASALAMGMSAGTAAAASGEVVVFETEMQQLTTYTAPEGCHKLPMAAHVLVNNTDQPVRIYGDPFCLTPSVTVQPGYGSHVAPGSGSFSA
ncbi:hypothetical protein SAMN05421805_1354 [Saccharopolyspora antimicrobica]|uniref:Uncharacterized protein n=1 Tax=Saccharopolyspora antimicrobica TaxID=455193 RepID=A0A1I5M252_9PSEU|nr:hypothetical protein [Saccharopolyspora antimicrobica]RKT89230.1 hypothetical protein ATL45_7684 [Saccharopolyspora antimicrobica]SFP03056.1 hypothetical protein SAMN05421805_1354 [Saccharopolyspora antimicrobica]